MRILFLIRSLESGGAERQLVLLANGLARAGHTVGIAVFYPRGGLEQDLDGPVLFSLEKSGRWDIFSFIGRLVSLARSFQPDVLHSYLGTANNLAVLIRPLLPNLSVVWGIRASNVDFACYGRVARLDSMVESKLSRFADRIIFNSQQGFEDAAGRGVRTDAGVVIPNGIDTHRFAPDRDRGRELRKAWGADEEHCLVGIVGRLDPMKNHMLFLRAAAELTASNPNLRFVCVGDGPLGEGLRDEAVRLGLEGVLSWAGHCQDMPSVYNAIDVCCLTSSFGEGFPNTLGEAMSCGVPCVATDVGDSGRVLGDAGVLVRSDDYTALVEGILTQCRRVAEGGVPPVRQHILDNFSQDRMIATTEKLLVEL